MRRRFSIMTMTFLIIATNSSVTLAKTNSSTETKKEINLLESKKNNIKNKILQLTQDSNNIEKEISSNEQKIEKILEKKSSYERELLESEDKLDIELESLKSQMVNYYTSSYTSKDNYFTNLIKCKSISDYVITSTHLEYAVNNKDKQVDKVEKIIDEQKQILNEIKKTETELKDTKNLLSSQKNSLNNQISDNKSKVRAIEKEQDKLEDILIVQEEEEERIRQEILKAQREAEEKRKQEEERKKQEQANKNQTAQQSSTSESAQPQSNPNSEGWISPVDSYRLTSPYGYRIHPITGKRQMHGGVDLAAPLNTNIKSVKSGTVIVSSYGNSYGNYIIVDHGNGMSTLYAHLNSKNVSVGQHVSRGQIIAKMGSTGMSTGSHLHFEVRKNGVKQNPTSYINL